MTTALREIMQGALFDYDGTLLDSLGAWRGLEDVLAREARITVTPKQRELFTTLTVYEIAEYFHQHYGIGRNADAVMNMIDDYMVDFYATSSTLLPGVVSFLEECVRAGIRMSVVSSSAQAYLQAGLRHTGIIDLFDAVVSVDDIGLSKREPHVFDHARSIMGTPVETTWGFEDSLYALQTLRQARYPTVGIYDSAEGLTFEEWGSKATIVVRSFTDLTLDNVIDTEQDEINKYP